MEAAKQVILEAKDDASVAKAIHTVFQAGKYGEAVEHLMELSSRRKEDCDPRVLHNLAIARYLSQTPRDHKALQAALSRVRQRVESSLSSAAVEPTLTEGQQQESNSDDEDYDTLLVEYNTAVVSLRMREYRTAVAALQRLFRMAQAADDWLAQRGCLLLADLCSHTNQPEEGLAVLAYLEACCMPTQQTPPPKGVPALSSGELSFALKVTRARLKLMLGEVQEAKKDLLDAAKGAKEDGLSSAISLAVTAQHELLQNNDHHAAELQMQVQQQQQGQQPHTISHSLCNLATIQASLKHHKLSTLYFSKVLKAEAASPSSVGVLGTDWTLQVCYNVGVQLLLSGKPRQAFSCLTSSIPLLASSPRLWVRLAECCVAVHTTAEQAAMRASLQTVGTGMAKKVIVPVSHTTPTTRETVATPTVEYGIQCCHTAVHLVDQQISKTPVTEMRSRLRNAALVNMAYLSLAVEDPVTALSSAKEILSVKQQKPNNVDETHRFLATTFAAEALCMLGDASQALKYLAPLVETPQISAALCASPFALETEQIACNNPGSLATPVSNVIKSAMFTNLAVATLLQRDDLQQAQQLLQQAILHHNSPSALLLQAYLELRAGNTDAALVAIKRGRSANQPTTK